VVVTTAKGVNGGKAVAEAAKQAADGNKRLFGFFGDAGFDHLPFRTANGDFTPVKGIRGSAESYSKEELESQPTLAQLTDAALTVLAAKKGQPFTLFVEAGDVDFALHDNNLDNAVGAVYSGEAAIAQIIKWVEANSNWDDSAMIVTADHGQYLVVDDPNALTGAGK
jgi:alkaline phosphatase